MSDKSSFQKLLVPLDGSKYSKKALKKACEIAKNFDSELVLLYVAEKSPINLLDRSEYLKILKKFGKKTLKDGLDFVQKNDLDAKTILKEGNIVSEIEKISKKEKIDLIIVGNKGFGPVTRFLLGSVSSKLSQTSKNSVLIVK